jgi:hypothetical protein
MAAFNGKIYVGTARHPRCVERATLDFFVPDKGNYASDAEVTCPPDRFDLDLRAEIWQYTPGTRLWRRVFRSPADVPNPRSPGRTVARDIGFRGMVVHGGALYVAGVSADEYIPELFDGHPPRLLRSTDGDHWTALDGGPATIQTPFGTQRPMGYRAMTTVDGRLFVTATGGLTGDGAAVEVVDPGGPSPTFTQVSPPTLSVFELEAFAHRLYLGGGSATDGYSVWRSAGSTGPLSFVPVVTGGAGRGADITSVVSMTPFKDHLYVGASGWRQLLPGSELIRLDAADHWDLVTGTTRTLPGGRPLAPLSGQADGFGNIFNGHFWRQTEYNGALFLGTNDWSHAFRDTPWLRDALGPGFGFDLYATCDGVKWWPVTTDAFGDGLHNFGLRSMAVDNGHLYLGSANHVEGTEVWERTDPDPCAGH